MKIAFLCGNLEPGRDGVGDYARRLAGELIRQGHASALVGLNDLHVSEAQFDPQETDGVSVPVLRLPGEMPWNERVIEAREWLERFNPAWLSFQFVPFGFHRKGLCFGLGKWLAAVNPGAAWHVMFHELWLGLGEDAPAKERIYGALQRHITLDLVARLRPNIVHTNAEPYRRVLKREGIKASILPLFSNIPRADRDGWDALLGPLVSQAIGKPTDRADVYLAGVLGGVHPEWSAEKAVEVVLPLVRRFQKRLVLVFHGKNNLSPDTFSQMKSALKGRAEVVVTGERPGAEISRILNTLDLGLATSPRQNIQKSGSAAAMLEHGLQVLVTRDDWRLRDSYFLPDAGSAQLLSPVDFAVREHLPVRDEQFYEGNNVHKIARQMITAMNPAPVLEPVMLS